MSGLARRGGAADGAGEAAACSAAPSGRGLTADLEEQAAQANNDADFMMHVYKVKPCPLSTKHEWRSCAYAHVGEAAARRDPGAHIAVSCPESKAKRPCPRGDACPFAHSAAEYFLHPSRYRTLMCKDGARCARPLCFFAHAEAQLRAPARPSLDARQLEALFAARAALAGGGDADARLEAELRTCVLGPLPPLPACQGAQAAAAAAEAPPAAAAPVQMTAAAVAAASTALFCPAADSADPLLLGQGRGGSSCGALPLLGPSTPSTFTPPGGLAAPPSAPPTGLQRGVATGSPNPSPALLRLDPHAAAALLSPQALVAAGTAGHASLAAGSGAAHAAASAGGTVAAAGAAAAAAAAAPRWVQSPLFLAPGEQQGAAVTVCGAADAALLLQRLSAELPAAMEPSPRASPAMVRPPLMVVCQQQPLPPPPPPPPPPPQQQQQQLSASVLEAATAVTAALATAPAPLALAPLQRAAAAPAAPQLSAAQLEALWRAASAAATAVDPRGPTAASAALAPLAPASWPPQASLAAGGAAHAAAAAAAAPHDDPSLLLPPAATSPVHGSSNVGALVAPADAWGLACAAPCDALGLLLCTPPAAGPGLLAPAAASGGAAVAAAMSAASLAAAAAVPILVPALGPPGAGTAPSGA